MESTADRQRQVQVVCCDSPAAVRRYCTTCCATPCQGSTCLRWRAAAETLSQSISRRSPNGPWTCLQSMPWSRETVSGRTLGSYLPSAIRGLSFPRAMGARRCRRFRDSTIHSWSPRTHSASATREWWRPTKPLGGCTVANCPRWSADSRNSSRDRTASRRKSPGSPGLRSRASSLTFTGVISPDPAATAQRGAPERCQSPGPWDHDRSVAARVVRQFRLEPRLFEVLQDWGYETDAAWVDRLAEATPEGLDDRPGWIVSETADAAGGEGRTATSANVIGLPFQGVQPPKRAQSAAIRPRMLFELRARIQSPCSG